MERKNRRRRKDTEQAIQSLQAEHKKLKKYGVNEIGWYEDRGEVAE